MGFDLSSFLWPDVDQGRQPQGSAYELDPAHPLYGGLQLAYCPGVAGKNLVTGEVAGLWGTSYSISPVQDGMSCWTESGIGCPTFNLPAAGSQDVTILLRTVRRPPSGNTYGIGTYNGSYNGLGIAIYHSSISNQWGIFYGANRLSAGELSPDDGKTHTYVVTRASDGACANYRDGVLKTTGSPALVSSTSTSWAINGMTGHGVGSGMTTIALVWFRRLSAAEIRSVSENPWQLLRPSLPRIPVSVREAVTPPPAPTVYTIWPSSTTPNDPNVSDPGAVNIGVRFKSDQDGFITGIRFYKHASNTGTHVGTLWTNAGGWLAAATFTDETASGWQQAYFDTPVAVTANTVYVASYLAPNGYYSADGQYFASAGVDNPPLHALQNGVSGSNGVYKYSSSTSFPTDTWKETNYWIDVSFQTTLSATVQRRALYWSGLQVAEVTDLLLGTGIKPLVILADGTIRERATTEGTPLVMVDGVLTTLSAVGESLLV